MWLKCAHQNTIANLQSNIVNFIFGTRHGVVHECCQNKWRALEQVIRRDYSRITLIKSMGSRIQLSVCAHICFCGM
jgi:hypothetical protein